MYCCFLQGPGQERDDIQELEDLWLSAHGRKRSQGAANNQAAGVVQVGTPHVQSEACNHVLKSLCLHERMMLCNKARQGALK